MSLEFIIAISVIYLVLIFGAAFVAGRNQWWRKRLSDSSLVYALSLGVYCTAWTFYGSVGRAAHTGLGYLGVYLGPTLIAPLWIFFLKKIIRISKHLRITSVADFVSSRYGKSTALGVLVSILCIAIVVPYISIQLKALEFSFKLLQDTTPTLLSVPFYKDPLILFGCIFTVFAIYFGTRKLDPSEKHPGVVSVVALESLIKLVAFLIGALVIVYSIFNGFEDIFRQAAQQINLQKLAILTEEVVDYQTWFWVMILSAFAFIFLPRQFHMAVVENNSVRHLKKAVWITPLYLFLISVLVIPVALAGRVLFDSTVEADTYLLSIPMKEGYFIVASIVFIGGLAAISGMIMTSVISLSIMISNNIFLPLLLRINKQYEYFLEDLNTRLLQLRRLLIIMVMLLSYGFYKGFSINYSIVSVGLISFAGIAQLAPAILLGLYWKSVTAKGAIAGFLAGVIIWAYTLPFANMAELDIVSQSILEYGPAGISWLRPTHLFGIEGMRFIAHGAFWSLTINAIITVGISLVTVRSPLEIAQSDIFLNPEKYYKDQTAPSSAFVREAKLSDLKKTLSAILGKGRFDQLLNDYFKKHKVPEDIKHADSNLINYIESHLSGSIGTASANIVLNNLVKQKPVDTEELIKLLDQTYQVHQYSQRLEKQRTALNNTTADLKKANEQLMQLDEMKNQFISNVTHELRTPITSIRSLADILKNYEVTAEEKVKFLTIISEESERVSELVNQVLDLRKVEVKQELTLSKFHVKELIDDVVAALTDMIGERKISVLAKGNWEVKTDKSKLKQILVNLISNAIKFTDEINGKIAIGIERKGQMIHISIRDNGLGIEAADLAHIFDRFYQVKRDIATKTKGSGLGLSISRSLAEMLGGGIEVKSTIGEGSEFRVSFMDGVS